MEIESVLQVGDKIRITTWLGSYIVKITRVTKTKAIADVVRKDGSRYTCEFKRKYYNADYINPWHREMYDMTKRELIK